jgi:hypothetical protein
MIATRDIQKKFDVIVGYEMTDLMYRQIPACISSQIDLEKGRRTDTD